MQAVVEAVGRGDLAVAVCLVVSNRAASRALGFAREHAVATACIPTTPDPEAADRRLHRSLLEAGAELVVLSGYLRRLGPETLAAFEGRILNVHPALLPGYGGKGMYGRRVHQAVLAAKEKETGASVHLVDAEYDHGRVIATSRVPVTPSDEVGDLEARVMAAETRLILDVVREISTGLRVAPF